MSTTALSSRARTLGRFAAAVVPTVVATLAIAGAADAAGTSTSSAEPPRIEITHTFTCNDSGVPYIIELFYDDLADGHVPQAVHEELVEGSTVVRTRDDLYQEYGNYFNAMLYPQGGTPLNPMSVFTYSVTITYDDGVTQTQSTTVDVASAQCLAPPPITPTTTTPAPGAPTLPETGASTSWVIAAFAGLLTATGGALFAGTRRSRTN